MSIFLVTQAQVAVFNGVDQQFRDAENGTVGIGTSLGNEGCELAGTILTSALAVLKARGEDIVASLTLLTTLLDFSDTGEIGGVR